MKIYIPKELKEFITIQEERDEASLQKVSERCGVLIGLKKDESLFVKEIVEVKNRAKNPNFFEMDAEELYKAWIHAEKRGMDIVAVFHTHPLGVAKPSRYDINGLRDSGMVWVIIGIDGVRAYIYRGELKEIEVEILD